MFLLSHEKFEKNTDGQRLLHSVIHNSYRFAVIVFIDTEAIFLNFNSIIKYRFHIIRSASMTGTC